ncbi:hypothetical protein KC930_00865 [Candidatus Saccharibacteria bacterium]|nr:hypothetical protein [Candidatus Saccharibacteria bacterium]
MRESLNEPVSVICTYNASLHRFTPLQLGWANETYRLGKVDFYHKTKSGTKVLHHFSMADVGGQVYFKLCFDADTLNWTLEEYMNAGEASVNYEGFGV